MANGNNTAASQPGITPVSSLNSVRAVKIARFLPGHERDALYAAVCANQTAFEPSGVPGSASAGSFYLSLESSEFDRPEVAAIRLASGVLSKRILEILPSLFAALGIEPFAVKEMPLTLVNGLDGHCGLPHADSIDGRYRISLLYYFHREPRAFQGGDLEIYAADPAPASGTGDAAIARIDQQDNLLIAFSSDTFHGITPVRCESDDFIDGRFAVISFLAN